MDLDQKQLDEILQTFKVELDERLQEISDCLLKIENTDKNTSDFTQNIEKILRAMHNIKGAARSLGLQDIGEIAHQLESLFASIKQQKNTLDSHLINFCLEVSDLIRTALDGYILHAPIPLNVAAIFEKIQVKKRATPTHINQTTIIKNDENSNKYEHESIRVSIAGLDKISSLMEEMQINKLAIDENYKDFANLHIRFKILNQLWKQMKTRMDIKGMHTSFDKLFTSFNDEITHSSNHIFRLKKDIHQRINALNIITSELQNEMKTLRLIPAEVFLRHLPRAVRDIANALHKTIEFRITGENVKMDKWIIEAIQNPIIHILRNAIDHGIEAEEVRLKKHKNKVGHIDLHVKEEGEHIMITIHDDGAGIDYQEMGKIAQEKNIIAENALEKMTPQQILDMIFLPGFSSKKMITEVSGRGVGLDVVKANIQDLKGKINIITQKDIGTTFELYLPLTLASERGLLIQCAGKNFAIPTQHIEYVLTLNPKHIVEIESQDAIVMHGKPIILRNLASILDIYQNSECVQPLSIVVMKNNTQMLGFIVDEIINEREIVIKSLYPPLAHIPGIVGATLSTTGDVIIVLDHVEILKRANMMQRTERILKKTTTDEIKEIPHILVVDDSITTRTLEKNILENHHFKVTTAINGKEALNLLNKGSFSLIITDINMPVMDGFTLTEHIKKSQQLKDIPVIIVTSLGSDVEKQRGIEVGANAYIVKNAFESDELLKIVEQLV
jgi:two-component system chemotaxis sensor kinase CheA